MNSKPTPHFCQEVFRFAALCLLDFDGELFSLGLRLSGLGHGDLHKLAGQRLELPTPLDGLRQGRRLPGLHVARVVAPILSILVIVVNARRSRTALPQHLAHLTRLHHTDLFHLSKNLGSTL